MTAALSSLQRNVQQRREAEEVASHFASQRLKRSNNIAKAEGELKLYVSTIARRHPHAWKTRLFDTSLLGSAAVLCSWMALVKDKERTRTLLAHFVRRRSHGLLKTALSGWWMVCCHRQHFRKALQAMIDSASTNLLVRALTAWKQVQKDWQDQQVMQAPLLILLLRL
jgi:hypothetical protein